MPFLTVVTRHLCTRPHLLEVCQASLAAQTCQDYEHYIIRDEIGQGWEYAHQILIEHAPNFQGEYIFVLDDDDWVACPRFVECLKHIAAEEDNPDVVMTRMDYAGQLLPGGQCWQGTPIMNHITMANFTVRRDVYLKHCSAFASGRYQADFDFINDVWKDRPRVAWHDCIAVKDQRGRGLGRPE